MHASIACLLLYEDYVWVSLGNAMKAKQSNLKAKQLQIESKGPDNLNPSHWHDTDTASGNLKPAAVLSEGST
jgi:hypothetical protein